MTIVIILILAGTTIVLTTSENGVIKQAQKSRFSSEATEIKEELERSQLGSLMKGTKYSIGAIGDIKIELEQEKKALEQAKTNAQDFDAMLATIEGALSVDADDLWMRMHELCGQYYNTTDTTEKETIKKEVSSCIQEINRIASEIEFNNMKVLDGTLNYAEKLGNENHNYGNLSIDIPDCSFEGLYGASNVDFSADGKVVINKIEEILGKISQLRSISGSKTNAIQYTTMYFEAQINNVENLLTSIFYDANGNELTDQEAMKNAKSNNTSIKLIEINQIIIDNIKKVAERIGELTDNCLSDEWTEIDDRLVTQKEIDELVRELTRELNHTIILNRNFLQGDFLYIKKVTISSLGLTSLSVLTVDEATKTKTKTQEAITKLQEIQDSLNKNIEELKSKKDQESDEKAGLEIDVLPQLTKLNEKYKDKFKIINGELFYIGNNENEKEWARELEILVQE